MTRNMCIEKDVGGGLRRAPAHVKPFTAVRPMVFIRQLSARVTGAVPYRLLDEASWATQGCAPLLRSAIAFSARRSLATYSLPASVGAPAPVRTPPTLSAAISPPPTRCAEHLVPVNFGTTC